MASAPEKHRITYGHVTDDIRDGAPVDATLKFHEDALAQMNELLPICWTVSGVD